KDRHRRLAHRARRRRQPRGLVSLEGQQPAARRRGRDHWARRIPAPQARMGLREVIRGGARSTIVTCRLCDAPIGLDADVCPSCGVRKPWVPDEPSANLRVIRLAMWGGGIVLGIMLLFVVGMLAFGPAAEKEGRDHRPPSMGTRAP